MPKSPSNRALLVTDLRQLVLRYREAPSTLLAELEAWMDTQGIGLGQHRREIEKSKQSDLLEQLRKEDFENRSDFPGWENL